MHTGNRQIAISTPPRRRLPVDAGDGALSGQVPRGVPEPGRPAGRDRRRDARTADDGTTLPPLPIPGWVVRRPQRTRCRAVPAATSSTGDPDDVVPALPAVLALVDGLDAVRPGEGVAPARVGPRRGRMAGGEDACPPGVVGDGFGRSRGEPAPPGIGRAVGLRARGARGPTADGSTTAGTARFPVGGALERGRVGVAGRRATDSGARAGCCRLAAWGTMGQRRGRGRRDD